MPVKDASWSSSVFAHRQELVYRCGVHLLLEGCISGCFALSICVGGGESVLATKLGHSGAQRPHIVRKLHQREGDNLPMTLHPYSYNSIKAPPT